MPEPTTGDPVKSLIARAVQRYLVVTGLDLSPLPEVTAVEAHPLGALATGVVITMADQRLRYFIVRVSEFSHLPEPPR
jgi:hypothetical protein